ncbi:PREDICTED: beta-1,4-N-acetylgalactosaminyltransferase 3-like [Cyprinodon variegatus]|uniref:Beta-1,4-N-acetylgalactosaminyltransferase n=1 Tax=Cyprinodon variegatus TaxID=28743 RepID=A0A3Q2CEQ4_CYPVA|nr:PREDICTED: beta-1,4-N-acetylgalactosaminyltransferase 3-like [Cyprinodon variegatus]
MITKRLIRRMTFYSGNIFVLNQNMFKEFFPLKKLRRNGKYFLFAAILLFAVLAIYHEMLAARGQIEDVGGYPESNNLRRDVLNQKVRRDDRPDWVEDSAAWVSSFTPQTWKPEFKGQANLHVFEDWCGTSTAELRKNLHYPLYPHSRTTVQKLAVSPRWTNYGLRIFGYLHPYAEGDFVFAISSDDNSEFWLSTDHSPRNVQLLAWVGKTGSEWTAPGEFEKYASQTSKPVKLSSQKRYFFEVIHKQNDRGTDHVEVAWQLLDHVFEFKVIESKHISLYADESDLLLSEVAHIPQTAASHQNTPTKQSSAAADMLREDPRDSLYQVHLINSKFLQGVLPDCTYNPTYTIKDYPLLRYQGLQFVHMSYIYPNDYTRLTHMETENTCFYPESSYYKKMYGFSRYMRFDRLDKHKNGNTGRDFGLQNRNSVQEEEDDNDANEERKETRIDQMNNNVDPDYGDDYDDYVQNRRRKLFSFVAQDANETLEKSPDERGHIEDFEKRKEKSGISKLKKDLGKAPKEVLKQSMHQNRTEEKQEVLIEKREPVKRKVRPVKKRKVKPEQTNPPLPVGKEIKAKQQPAVLPQKHTPRQRPLRRAQKTNHTQIRTFKDPQVEIRDRHAAVPQKTNVTNKQNLPDRKAFHPAINSHFTTPSRTGKEFIVKSNEVETDPRKGLREKEIELNKPLRQDLDNQINANNMNDRRKNDKKSYLREDGGPTDEGDTDHVRAESRKNTTQGDGDSMWEQQGDLPIDPDEEDQTPAPVFDAKVNWNQTFQVDQLDLQSQRSDWIDLNCNISGNMLLNPSDALTVVYAFMDHLNAKHNGRFTLIRVINVVKRVDGYRGSRYLLELELKDANGQLLRLTHYIYALIHHSEQWSQDFAFRRSKPQLVLCNPVGFRWNPGATVHFIVPVKNQARWVQQLITDMEEVFRQTGDSNFNLIITDYDSTDMDVKQALQKSSLPRYQYVKLTGNFQRSAGLQAGIDLIDDDHSIVFLCDLHIHFPSSITDTIRKHCVEGYMAFAPIVLRLNCGSTPSDARGYWEVNGFGLLGIYKSDLDAIGGMNTREFRERWGGEDWELLDRILQGGLEVERIYLRNFFHHYHSKRGMWNRKMSMSQV